MKSLSFTKAGDQQAILQAIYPENTPEEEAAVSQFISQAKKLGRGAFHQEAMMECLASQILSKVLTHSLQPPQQ
jgi:hypothetical protein